MLLFKSFCPTYVCTTPAERTDISPRGPPDCVANDRPLSPVNIAGVEDVTDDKDRGSGGKNVIFSNGPRVNSEYPNPFR